MNQTTRSRLALCCGILSLGFGLWAQDQPRPKSQKELEALRAVQSAKTPDEQLKAIENVLENFADTQYKVILLQSAVQIEQQKGDFAQVVFYCQRLIEADPKNAFGLVTLAAETARHTREFDLDKEEKLAGVDKYAKAAIEAAKQMPKPRPDITDEQWEGARKDMESQAYEAEGMAAALRKKYDEAIADYKQALTVAATKDPATMVRMGQVYIDAGKLDDAAAAFDNALSSPVASPQVKTVAQAKKEEVAKRKAAAGAKPPGTH